MTLPAEPVEPAEPVQPFEPAGFAVAVLGAGPAGLAAAVHAAEQGARTVLLDSGSRLGGQYWRHVKADPNLSGGGPHRPGSPHRLGSLHHVATSLRSSLVPRSMLAHQDITTYRDLARRLAALVQAG